MISFEVFRGFKFKGNVTVECIKCGKKEEIQVLKHVDITEISNQIDRLCKTKFYYTTKGVYCARHLRENIFKYIGEGKYCPELLRRGVNKDVQEGVVGVL